MHQEMNLRWVALRDALNHYRANFNTMPNQGGSVFWVQCPEEIDVNALAREAARRGILIEPDTHYYARSKGSRNCFRMGVASIPQGKIREGVEHLRELMWEVGSGQAEYLDDEDPAFLKGTLVGRAGHANEDCDRGRWWVEGDLWCRQWD